MDSLSIIGDLGKLAGPVRGAQKIVIEPAAITTPAHTAPEITIDKIAAMIKSPFKPRLFNGAPRSEDGATIEVYCGVLHHNRYLVRDIIELDGIIKCTTCNLNNRYITLARTAVEKMLTTPFSAIDPVTRGKVCDLSGVGGKIIIECCKPERSFVEAEILHIQIPRTLSMKKINEYLERHLREHVRMFDGKISDTINNIGVTPPKPDFIEGPLPYTRETANMVLIARRADPAAIKCMKLVSNEMLCIENCKN